MKRRLRKALGLFVAVGTVALVAAAVFVRWGNGIAIALETDEPSHSTGTTSDGKLFNGKRLPTCGANFRAYGRLPIAFGRNSVHGAVRNVVIDAYGKVHETHPGLKFVYGECGWPKGGRFRPHATHRNGLSVDFMVPVKNESDTSLLKCRITNKYGYSVHFDETGYCAAQSCHIDFQAMAEHLLALHESAEEHGLRIWRVIFAPDLQPLLFQTGKGDELRKKLKFSERQSWVRHDEHYHVDFHNPDEEYSQ
jgi:penicillin-insensitive murein DD-endopeptidase